MTNFGDTLRGPEYGKQLKLFFQVYEEKEDIRKGTMQESAIQQNQNQLKEMIKKEDEDFIQENSDDDDELYNQ